MDEQYKAGLVKAKEIAEQHVQRARGMVAGCKDWSVAQGEWSRARDLGMDIVEAIEREFRDGRFSGYGSSF